MHASAKNVSRGEPAREIWIRGALAPRVPASRSGRLKRLAPTRRQANRAANHSYDQPPQRCGTLHLQSHTGVIPMSNRYVPFILAAALGASAHGASAEAHDKAADHATTGRSIDAATACSGLPTHDALRTALGHARGAANGGFDLDMWAAVVNRDGIVCAVAFTGGDRGSQWPGSRVIAAQKANTANAFSLPGLALSTANL